MSPHRTTHSIEIAAPAADVYAVVADAEAWPHTFAPTVHVERTALEGNAEQLQIWARANDEVKAWTSRRDLDPQQLRVTFAQQVSTPPVESMSGEWIVTAVDDSHSTLTLLHTFTAVDDDPAGVEWITTATDRNSNAELSNLKSIAEVYARRKELVFYFADAVVIDGPLETAYEFLYEAKLWGDRLPHVGHIDVVEDEPNIQSMVMETVTKDGSRHTTESIRICFPDEKIAYKQTKTPPLMTAHTGVWTFEAAGDFVKVTSHHIVALNESMITKVLGEDATLDSAKTFIRNAVGGNSAATLALTKKFVEESQ